MSDKKRALNPGAVEFKPGLLPSSVVGAAAPATGGKGKKRNNNRQKNKQKAKKNNAGKKREDESVQNGTSSAPNTLHNKPTTRGGNKKGKKAQITSVSQPARSRRPPANPVSKKELNAKRQLYADMGFSELSARLQAELIGNHYTCKVCLDIIKRSDSAGIWTCNSCYTMLHIGCMQKWWRKTNDAVTRGNDVPNEECRCPGCLSVVGEAPKASCHCGRVRNVKNDPLLVPHSCGEHCERFECPHGGCRQLCHPGPCTPCDVYGAVEKCACGKADVRKRCDEAQVLHGEPKSCGDVCGKMRECGCQCDAQCHAGRCPPCGRLELQSCYCGAERERRPCGSGVLDDEVRDEGDDDDDDGIIERRFSCHRTCGRVLECGVHKCELECHAGRCAPCALSPLRVTTCACGKRAARSERAACTDPIEVCGGVCEKALSCGAHKCEQACHEGSCAPCAAKVKWPCRCGRTEKSVACPPVPSEVVCNTKCTKPLSCQKHTCRERCCPYANVPPSEVGASAHLCVQACGKVKSCGVHRCEQQCGHDGPCHACLEAIFEERSCHCGKTVVHPPIKCGTPLPPPCPHPCQRKRPCGHSHLNEHNAWTHTCHGDDVECPPCAVLVTKQCIGHGTDIENVRCSQMQPSCGKRCGRGLACGLHRCDRFCHDGACVEPSDASAQPPQRGLLAQIEGCGRPCGKQRKDCTHRCQAPCHPREAECPLKLPCHAPVVVACACGRRREEKQCCERVQQLPCVEQCLEERRRTQLAEAFGVRGTAGDGAEGLRGEVYSDFLSHFAEASPMFVRNIESSLEGFARVRTQEQFATQPMEPTHRKVVHELARYYGVETSTVTDDAGVHVLVRRTDDTRVPTVKLSDSLSPVQKPFAPRHERLMVSGLDESITTKDVLRMFGKHCVGLKLKWLDDENCLVSMSPPMTAVALIESATLPSDRVTLAPFSDVVHTDFGRVGDMSAARRGGGGSGGGPAAAASSHVASRQQVRGANRQPSHQPATTSGGSWAAIAMGGSTPVDRISKAKNVRQEAHSVASKGEWEKEEAEIGASSEKIATIPSAWEEEDDG